MSADYVNRSFIICALFIINTNVWAQAPVSQSADNITGPVVEMEPYVVKGERILPEPESWFYIKIPAIEIKRKNRVVFMPGYELLSPRSRQNSLVFAGELQMRQVANAVLFPDLVSALPRTAIVIVMDDGRLQKNIRAGSWSGDSLYTATALRQSNGQPDARYFVGTQMPTNFYGDYVAESPSLYAENADRAAPDTDYAESRANAESKKLTNMVAIATNGGPLTVYLDDTRAYSGGGGAGLMPVGAASFDVGAMNDPWSASMPRTIRGTVRHDDGSMGDLVPPPDIQMPLRRPGDLLRHVRMDKSGAVTEWAFARELSQRLVLLGCRISRQNEPEWIRYGFGYLCKELQVTPRQIEFGAPMQWMGYMPKLSEVLSEATPLLNIRNGPMLASAFVHYCLFADGGAWSAKLSNFLSHLEKESFSEALFVKCFGKTTTAFQSSLASHALLMASGKGMIQKWDMPPLPDIIAREATQSEVARLKAELLIAQGQSAKALDELRISYWRGERDPWMMALLALLEEHIGSLERARKITKTLLDLNDPPARAYLVAAKLRLRQFAEGRGPDEKLKPEESAPILQLLVQARTRGILNEDICTTLSKLIIKSTTLPDDDIIAFINEAAKRYPLNKSLIEASRLCAETNI